MTGDDMADPRLSHLATPWTALGEAHAAEGDPRLAQAKVLFHYRPAISRYLTKLTTNPDLAEELCQEFALRFLRGDFQNVRPERGRFRDYVKAALRNLVSDHYRRRTLPTEPLPSESQLPPASGADEDDFSEIWSCELMLRAWAALRADSAAAGNHYYEALRLKVEDPQRRAEDIATLLTQRVGTPYKDVTVRQMLRRGREKFTIFLRDAIRESLPADESDQVDQELADLGLLVYVTSPRR